MAFQIRPDTMLETARFLVHQAQCQLNIRKKEGFLASELSETFRQLTTRHELIHKLVKLYGMCGPLNVLPPSSFLRIQNCLVTLPSLMCVYQ